MSDVQSDATPPPEEPPPPPSRDRDGGEPGPGFVRDPRSARIGREGAAPRAASEGAAGPADASAPADPAVPAVPAPGFVRPPAAFYFELPAAYTDRARAAADEVRAMLRTGFLDPLGCDRDSHTVLELLDELESPAEYFAALKLLGEARWGDDTPDGDEEGATAPSAEAARETLLGRLFRRGILGNKWIRLEALLQANDRVWQLGPERFYYHRTGLEKLLRRYLAAEDAERLLNVQAMTVVDRFHRALDNLSLNLYYLYNLALSKRRKSGGPHPDPLPGGEGRSGGAT